MNKKQIKDFESWKGHLQLPQATVNLYKLLVHTARQSLQTEIDCPLTHSAAYIIVALNTYILNQTRLY